MVWGSIISAGASLLGGRSRRRAARRAAEAQAAAEEARIAQFRPWQQAGAEAISAQRRLLGLAGAEAQQQDVTALEQSPWFQSMARQGEDALLQNASATGGLRGGNIQAALAQFRPQMLREEMTSRLNHLGGLAGQGLRAGEGMAGAFTNQGQAQAGGIISRERVNQDMLGTVANAAGGIFQRVLGSWF